MKERMWWGFRVLSTAVRPWGAVESFLQTADLVTPHLRGLMIPSGACGLCYCGAVRNPKLQGTLQVGESAKIHFLGCDFLVAVSASCFSVVRNANRARSFPNGDRRSSCATPLRRTAGRNTERYRSPCTCQVGGRRTGVAEVPLCGVAS